MTFTGPTVPGRSAKPDSVSPLAFLPAERRHPCSQILYFSEGCGRNGIRVPVVDEGRRQDRMNLGVAAWSARSAQKSPRSLFIASQRCQCGGRICRRVRSTGVDIGAAVGSTSIAMQNWSGPSGDVHDDGRSAHREIRVAGERDAIDVHHIGVRAADDVQGHRSPWLPSTGAVAVIVTAPPTAARRGQGHRDTRSYGARRQRSTTRCCRIAVTETEWPERMTGLRR